MGGVKNQTPAAPAPAPAPTATVDAGTQLNNGLCAQNAMSCCPCCQQQSQCSPCQGQGQGQGQNQQQGQCGIEQILGLLLRLLTGSGGGGFTGGGSPFGFNQGGLF